MNTIFNSLDKFFKQPIGPVRRLETITLRLKIPQNYFPQDVQVIFYEYCAEEKHISFSMDFESESYDNFLFKVQIKELPVNIYKYYFAFNSNGHRRYVKMCENSWEGQVVDNNLDFNWQLTVYEPIITHPNMRNGIMYQIFPDRFYKSGLTKKLPQDRIYRNWGELPYFSDDKIGMDFFGGDLKGIIQKLKYLKDLNVSVLYFNPIWEAQSNHRYNTSSYLDVDPVLGNIEDLKHLITKAHSLNMIVILDTVLNHTGSDSIYFNKYDRYPVLGAYNSKESPFYDWYYFHEDKETYETWWGFKTLPKVNQNNASFIEYFFGIGGVLDKWFELGIDGLRLDVADELENDTLNRIYNVSKRNRKFIVIIGEVWDNASNKCNYDHRMNYFLGSELTSVMNYPVKDALLAYIRYGGEHWANNLKNTLISIFIEDYPYEISHSLMNFLSTHDTVRAITKLAGKEVDNHGKTWQFNNDDLSYDEYILGRSRLMLSYMILYFLPGVPSIFYGDEIGLSGQKDPFCRKCFNWEKMDDTILNFMKALGNFRKSLPKFFSDSNFDVYEVNNEICILARFFEDEDRIIFLFANRTDLKIDFSIEGYIIDTLNRRFTNSISLKKGKFYSLFSLGNSNLHSIDAFGGVIVEVV